MPDAARSSADVDAGRILLKTPFSNLLLCKRVPGAAWDGARKVWTYPATPRHAHLIRATIPGLSASEGFTALLAGPAKAQAVSAPTQKPEPQATTPLPAGLKTTPWRHQVAAYQFSMERLLQGPNGVMLAMGMGCVAGDAELIVNRGGNARRMTLRDFHYKFHGGATGQRAWDPTVASYSRSLMAGEIRLNRVLNVLAQGVKPVLRLNLASGRLLRVTEDHEIACPDGRWVEAGRLCPGDVVLTNGIPACRTCGGTSRVTTYRYAKHVGVCRSCIGKMRRVKGRVIDKDGYVRLYGAWRHPRANAAGQVYEHIVVMEHVLGRPIGANEHIHHRNGVRHDNRPENLEVLPAREHHRHHGACGGYLHLDGGKMHFLPKPDVVVAVEPDGETDVYDLQMADPGHNFVANGIIVHNCGKSLVACMLLLSLGAKRVMIACPLRVVQVWLSQFERHVATPMVVVALDEDAGSVADKQHLAEEKLRLAQVTGVPFIAVINYDSAWRAPFAEWAEKQTWDLVVADECVPPDTMIDAPRGPWLVQNLNVGDIVWGFDHSAGRVVPTTVSATFHRLTPGPLIAIGGLLVTPHHPIWTEQEGYVAAQEVSQSSLLRVLCDETTTVRMVRDCVRTGEAPAVLRQIVFGEVADVPSLVRPELGHSGPGREVSAEHAPPPSESRGDGQIESLSPFRPEPFSPTRCATEGDGHSSGEEVLSPDRRERGRTHARTEDFSGGASVGDRGGCSHETAASVSMPLQTGHRQPADPSCHRGGWRQPRRQDRQSEGQEEGGVSAVDRLEGSPLQKPGSPLGSAARAGVHPHLLPVYNLETTTGNYFANGILVHNCHRLKAPGGKSSLYFKRLRGRARHRLALTGTPMPHSPLDVYAQFRFLNQTIFGPSFAAFRQKYAVMGGFQRKQVTGFQNLEELEALMRTITFRISKDVLELPPETHVTYYCELSREATRIYRDLEDDFVAEVRDGRITVSNAMVKLLRLQQVAGGWVKTDDGQYHRVDSAKEKLLADTLEDIGPAEPVVVFCRFHADLDAVHEAAKSLGCSSLELSGRRDELKRWQDGEAQVLAVQISAGGVGVDLTRARYCILYSLSFSLGEYDQALSRVHRPGQTRPVEYIHLVARNTVDTKIMRALEKRAEVVGAILAEIKA